MRRIVLFEWWFVHFTRCQWCDTIRLRLYLVVYGCGQLCGFHVSISGYRVLYQKCRWIEWEFVLRQSWTMQRKSGQWMRLSQPVHGFFVRILVESQRQSYQRDWWKRKWKWWRQQQYRRCMVGRFVTPHCSHVRGCRIRQYR